jgi:hypothetical protein
MIYYSHILSERRWRKKILYSPVGCDSCGLDNIHLHNVVENSAGQSITDTGLMGNTASKPLSVFIVQRYQTTHDCMFNAVYLGNPVYVACTCQAYEFREGEFVKWENGNKVALV